MKHEILDLYDDNFNKLDKTIVRRVDEIPEGCYVMMSYALIKNNDKYLLEQATARSNNTLAIPGGHILAGEDGLTGLKRELKEETGAVATNYMSLGKLYPTPGYCGEIIHMYLATDLEFGEQNPDEDEFLEVYKISLEEAVKMVMNGELPDSKTQTMILKINQMKNEGKI